MILLHVLPFRNDESELQLQLQHCLCSIPLYHAIVDTFMDSTNHVHLFLSNVIIKEINNDFNA